MAQLVFANAILEGLTLAQAWKRAGFIAKNDRIATANASRALATNESLRAYVERETAKRFEAASITGEKIMAGLWREAHEYGEGSQHGARVAAFGTLAKIAGLFQADRKNDADAEADLLRDIRCRFAIGLHVAQGVPLEEALRIAEKNPLDVEDWAVGQGLLQRSLPAARGEIVVEQRDDSDDA